jgi:hypothetical protein
MEAAQASMANSAEILPLGIVQEKEKTGAQASQIEMKGSHTFRRELPEALTRAHTY